VAIALPSINKLISPILFTRISSIVFIYAGALSLNALYIQSIGSGIGIYSGLFQVTTVSQLIDTFIFIIGSLILIAWPSITNLSSPSNISAPHSLEAEGQDLLADQTQKNYYKGLKGLSNSNINILNKITTNRINNAVEYSLIVLFSTLGASLLVSSADLISMYLSIELQSFGVYILTTLYRDSESATSAGLKYFLLGGLSSCLILLGAGIVYTFTGLTNFESIYSLVSVSYNNNIIQGLSLGFIIIIVGFLFKIAAAPLHNWSPDVYDDSPTIVTIWITIMPKISIIIFILELYTQIGIIGNSVSIPSVIDLLSSVNSIHTNLLENVGTEQLSLNTIPVLKNLLLLSSLISLIIGTVVGLAQTRIKRLLAYSTISHIGFILLALAINTEQSIDSLIFYILQYTITNLNTFLILIALGYILNNSFSTNPDIKNSKLIPSYKDRGSELDIKYISELKGQFFSNPLLSLSLSVCLFSMAGIPPLLGFFSKQFVLYSAVQSGYYFMSIIAIIVSIISASYYIKIVRVLHTEPNNLNDNTENQLNNSIESLNNNSSLLESDSLKNKGLELSIISNFHSYLISTLTLSILFFILKPSILLNSTQLLSLSLFNF
jgi:NADH-ubiquinone oxidoreductase chain 2